MKIIEGDDILKAVTSPSGAPLKGTVRGNKTNAIRTGEGNTFQTVLVAGNDYGETSEMLTLSFITELPVKPTVSPDEATDSAEEQWKPQWGEQYSPAPAGTAPSTISREGPDFFQCPESCPYCLTSGEAASMGFNRKCSEELCYYSPEKQQKWYCYSEPEGWCCKDTLVSQTTKSECILMGGDWYASQAEAMIACQPKCWCCRVDGMVGNVTVNECLKVGTCYNTRAEAVNACQQLLMCWCCVEGKVIQTTQTQCIKIGGTCYFTQSEALERCYREPPPIPPPTHK
jgi:hypothetical protein